MTGEAFALLRRVDANGVGKCPPDHERRAGLPDAMFQNQKRPRMGPSLLAGLLTQAQLTDQVDIAGLILFLEIVQ